MTDKDTIQELKELGSMLAGLPTQNAYSVPEGYFEGLAMQVLNRIKALDADNAGEELSLLAPLLDGVSRKSPYSVPDGYFNGLEGELMAAIHQQNQYQSAEEELLSLSPVLGSIDKRNPYKVPQGYFENLGNNINLKSGTQSTVKLVSMVSRKWFRYAAAAVVIGFIALTGIEYFNNNSGTISNPQAWVERNMKKVSTDEINNFIQISDEGSADQNSLATSSKATEIKDLMKDVSDKDIQDFLNKTSSGSEESDGDILLN